MELVGVRMEVPSSSPIALLREVGGAQRLLPIFIGAPEANAIVFALEEVVTQRPLTHDLFREVLDDEDEEEPPSEDVVEQFREFIDSVDPEDFAL